MRNLSKFPLMDPFELIRKNGSRGRLTFHSRRVVWKLLFLPWYRTSSLLHSIFDFNLMQQKPIYNLGNGKDQCCGRKIVEQMAIMMRKKTGDNIYDSKSRAELFYFRFFRKNLWICTVGGDGRVFGVVLINYVSWAICIICHASTCHLNVVLQVDCKQNPWEPLLSTYNNVYQTIIWNYSINHNTSKSHI